MADLNEKVVSFLKNNKVATVCFVTTDNMPYCINCFYAYDEKNNMLVFKSSFGTSHDTFIKPDAPVSGTILPNSVSLLNAKGIQFSGKLINPTEIDYLKLPSLYTKNYVMSLAMLGYIWAVRLEFIKYTDNSLGFGNKIIWHLEKPSQK
ncbi:MAG: hypothetical protein ABI388_00830 [Bacteroidia bacterium]